MFSEISPCEESTYFPLPQELKNPMKGFISIQNKFNESFRWCLVRHLNPGNKKPSKIESIDTEVAKKTSF